MEGLNAGHTMGVPWAAPSAQSTATHMLGRVLLLARLLTLGMVGAFATVAAHLELLSAADFRPWWLLIVAVAATFSWLQLIARGRLAQFLPLLEAGIALVVVATASTGAWPLLVYLVMAPVLVGIAAGGWYPVLVSGAQFAAFASLYALDLTLWVTVPPMVLAQLGLAGLTFGIATAIVRHLVYRDWKRRGSYAQALALLRQLSDLSRELPSGLGMDAVLAGTQETLGTGTGAEESAIFAPTADGWRMLAGPREAEALLTACPFSVGRSDDLHLPDFTERDPSNPWLDSVRVRLLPMRDDGTLRGVAVLRFSGRVPSRISGVAARELGEEAAARIGAAQVYAEVRERATAEERRRVSREIHDGVAQDLAALTYTLDNIAAASDLEPVAVAAGEVRRLVRELRLSIFDLRTDVGNNQTLGSAIGEYAQQITASTNLVVHTTVSDRTPCVDPALQHEILRICQEAVANARRHAQAHNLWITYRSSSERRLLRIADDGVGAFDAKGPRGAGGEGLSIMAERVQRIGGHLAVRRRLGGGTVVEVTVSGPGSGNDSNDDARELERIGSA